MDDNVAHCPCGDADDAVLVTKDDISGMHNHATAIEGPVVVNDQAANGLIDRMHIDRDNGELHLWCHPHVAVR